MNANEKEAILGYSEFHLLKFVERFERFIDDPDVVGEMYDAAYFILNDLEHTFDMQLLLNSSPNEQNQC